MIFFLVSHFFGKLNEANIKWVCSQCTKFIITQGTSAVLYLLYIFISFFFFPFFLSCVSLIYYLAWRNNWFVVLRCKLTTDMNKNKDEDGRRNWEGKRDTLDRFFYYSEQTFKWTEVFCFFFKCFFVIFFKERQTCLIPAEITEND